MTKNYSAHPDTSLTIAGVYFKNPVIAASGTFGYGKEYAGVFDISMLGGICTKGLTLNPRGGNSGNRIWETPSGMLNSIGLENPGIKAFIEHELPRLQNSGTVVIANLSGGSIEEYAEGAKLLNESAVGMIELNISCPNVKKGGMLFGLDPACAGDVTAAVKKVIKKPLIVKLSPNAADINAVAAACVQNGADALSLVNTFKGMAIDTEKRKPVFDNIFAGLSGAAIRPIALRMVWDLCHSPNINIPVIGLGGIDSSAAAIEFLLAGAAAIQVGCATFANPHTMPDIIDGIVHYMIKHHIQNLSELGL
ncbi:MAG: dihydroorotate dehydrogenase [Termitinemataceae bacterium]|nr:MAG: dihydroorotate dehydrogenase [Termitinemataceae bacterium]